MKEKNLHNPIIKFDYDKKYISKDTDFRIYRDAIMLTPGEFTDSLSRYPVVYTEEELKKSAKIWSDNYLNVDHSFEVQKRIGFVKNSYYKDGGVRGDLYIHQLTNASKETIALIDAGLVNWLSVELLTEDKWNAEDNKRYASDIEFIGCAVVLHPACDGTKINGD